MRLASKITCHPPDGMNIRHPAGDDERLSGSPGADRSCLQFRIFSILVGFFVLMTLLLPGAVMAVRLAEEEPPASVLPVQPPIAPAGIEPAAVQSTAPPAPIQPIPPASSVDAAVAGEEKTTQEIPPEDVSSSPRERPDVVAPLVESPQPLSEPPTTDAGPGNAGTPSSPDQGFSRTAQPPAGGPAASPTKPQSPRPPEGAAVATRYVTIDFDDVDISVFIKFVSELTGKNFLIDNRVKGKVTVISPKKIALDEVYKVFESVLEIYGFTTVEAGEVTKVIPSQDARAKKLDLLMNNRDDVTSEDRVVTHILTLQNANPDEMKKILDPLISKTSIIQSYQPTGMLIITDVISNIQRLQKIITALDVPGVGEIISYIPLRFSTAQEMVKPLMSIFTQQAGKRTVAPVRIVADERANALVLLATENDTTRVRELIDLMDREIPKGAGTVRVYYLQNAKSEDMVKVLTGISQQTKTATVAKAGAAGTEAVFSKNIQVLADKATNSLIISADKADYPIIEDVIQKLDITRPMVYLEALIMEVNADKSFNVGVEWSLVKDVKIGYVENMGGKSAALAGFSGSSIIPQVNTQAASPLAWLARESISGECSSPI
jgi:type II secretory pathway component HofQ